MVRTIFALCMVALLAVTAGCRVCAHPYDYCGPLFDGQGGQYCCCPNARAGSILSPNPMMGTCNCGAQTPQVLEEDVAPQPIPQNELTRRRPSHVKPLPVKTADRPESGPKLIQPLTNADYGPMPGVQQKVREYSRSETPRWAGRQSRTTRQR